MSLKQDNIPFYLLEQQAKGPYVVTGRLLLKQCLLEENITNITIYCHIVKISIPVIIRRNKNTFWNTDFKDITN